MQAPLAEIDAPAAPTAPGGSAVPPPPAPNDALAFSLDPGQSDAILNYDDPTTCTTAIKALQQGHHSTGAQVSWQG